MSMAERGSDFHLKRCFARQYCGVESRETIWISLLANSETAARRKSDRA